MANILYGVHGTGHGHAVRARTIAQNYPQHNFLFVSNDDGYNLLNPKNNVLKLPSYPSPVNNHTIQIARAMAGYCKTDLNDSSYRVKTIGLVEPFKPELAITDYEPNIPWMSMTLGIPCLSIDNQHIVRFGSLRIPFSKRIDLAMMRVAMFLQFRIIQNFMVVSFFDIDMKSTDRVTFFPPLLRKEVVDRSPSEKEFVLAYHGYATTKKFHAFLQSIPRPVYCYGGNIEDRAGNVTYKKNSTEGFLDDLACCHYIVCSAGHTLISEALYYGKPVMAFPIKNAFEQYLNGYYIAKQGFGMLNDAFRPSMDCLDVFEKKWEVYKATIATRSFNGNQRIFSTLDHFFQTKQYTMQDNNAL